MTEETHVSAHATGDNRGNGELTYRGAGYGEEWDVLMLSTGCWTRARIIFESGDRIELELDVANIPEKMRTLATTRQAMRDRSIYRRAA